MNAINQPLSGVKVVEFCTTAAGPFCAMLLADMGADVIKIEPPSGDGLRQWPPITNGFSENFASVNRNKRSMVLDLKLLADAQTARRLVLDSDVLIENNRPGVMDRLGLGYAALSALKPSLVYCSISAFGQSGPRSGEGGFDLTIQAAAGVMSVTGEDGGAPVKCGVPIADFSSGLYGAFSIASALMAVRSGAPGAHLDIPMFGCTLAIAASDGYFAIAAGNHSLWLKVLDVVGMPALADDPRFKSTLDRATNQAALKEVLDPVFAGQTAAHWLHAFEAAGVPHAPINDYESALADPQVEHMGWVQPLRLPDGTMTRTFGSPVRFNGQTLPVTVGPPQLGQHTETIRATYDASGSVHE